MLRFSIKTSCFGDRWTKDWHLTFNTSYCFFFGIELMLEIYGPFPEKQEDFT